LGNGDDGVNGCVGEEVGEGVGAAHKAPLARFMVGMGVGGEAEGKGSEEDVEEGCCVHDGCIASLRC
jgi:hypothetical protein